MKKKTTGILSAGICAALVLTPLTGCGNSGGTVNLMDGMNAGQNPAWEGNTGQTSRGGGEAVACAWYVDTRSR